MPPNGPGDQLPPGHESWSHYTCSAPDASSACPGRSPETCDAHRLRPLAVSCIALLGGARNKLPRSGLPLKMPETGALPGPSTALMGARPRLETRPHGKLLAMGGLVGESSRLQATEMAVASGPELRTEGGNRDFGGPTRAMAWLEVTKEMTARATANPKLHPKTSRRRLTDLAISCRQAKRVGTTIPARRQTPQDACQGVALGHATPSIAAHGGQLHCLVRQQAIAGSCTGRAVDLVLNQACRVSKQVGRQCS